MSAAVQQLWSLSHSSEGGFDICPVTLVQKCCRKVLGLSLVFEQEGEPDADLLVTPFHLPTLNFY